jgi:RNA polymerase sigma factor (TIGR02999 family)
VSADITQLLLAHSAGEPQALDLLVPLVYDDLRRIARRQVGKQRPADSVSTTALVHEAYLRLVDQTRASYRNRGHFFAVCAMVMRRIVIDHARRRAGQKRGGGNVHVPLDDAAMPAECEADRLIDIDHALEKLARRDPRLARVVECRFFAGFTDEETAAALGVSPRTAQRDWFKARAWLRAELGQPA